MDCLRPAVMPIYDAIDPAAPSGLNDASPFRNDDDVKAA